ncbi:MAG: response regulator transcription factor [Gammaproteobacteria bacterium]|nr:response regulator transcription factor [Gammaproteobacteria bacterium]
MLTALKILLVDDHAVVRAGYRRLLENSLPEVGVCEADSGEHGYLYYTRQPFDLVVMDLTLPGIGGLETIRRITQRDHAARVLVFSIHDEIVFVERALKAGARGYISKSAAAEALVEAVERVLRGEIYLGPGIAERLAAANHAQRSDPLGALSPREFDIFRLLAEGRTVNEIAALLSLSAKTVANYNTQIRNKLNVASAAELARLAIRRGVVPA